MRLHSQSAAGEGGWEKMGGTGGADTLHFGSYRPASTLYKSPRWRREAMAKNSKYMVRLKGRVSPSRP